METYYFYDALGRLAAEYSNKTSAATGTTYLFADMLGSVRTVTDAGGAVVECRDHMPFGRMLSSADNGRNAAGCHPAAPGSGVASRTAQGFTGKERDEETGLDYFGARYMSSPLGRFISPDPYMPSASTRDPQSWNRYVYARNNPLRFIDPDGLDWSDLSGEQIRVFAAYASVFCKSNKDFCKEHAGENLNEDIYNTLDESQMATFESVTYALEHTQLIDSAGNSFGNALQQVAGVTEIAGEIPGASGDKQFRIFANMNIDGIENISRSQGFSSSSNEHRFLFFRWQTLHKGFPYSYRQNREMGVKGLRAGVQPSYSRDKSRADIDVDYRFGLSHIQPANSDIRAPGNYQRFIDRWPGLRNWWDK